MSKEGLGPLFRIEGTFIAAAYRDVLQHVFLPYVLDGPFEDGMYLFQHDGSPIHTARSVTKVLEEHVIPTLGWPPVGADINPIENIWGIMKTRLAAKNLGCTTADALWTALNRVGGPPLMSTGGEVSLRFNATSH